MGIFDRFSKKKSKEKTGTESPKKAVAATEAEAGVKVKEASTLKLKTDNVPTAEVKDAKSKKTAPKDDTRLAYKILVKPLITEKATNLVGLNKYAFKVSNAANKIEVKKAIKALYGFEPLSVNIINQRGKRITYGRARGKKSNWKKAIITLKVGEKLEIYEGV